MSLCLFSLPAEYFKWNAILDDAQGVIKIAGRNINNLRYADDTTLTEEIEEELKNLLMKVKEESKKAGLKLNVQKTKIMAYSPITSWQIHGETMETVTDFIFLGSKITAGGDCSYEIKRHLLLGRKAMTNLDSILKSRDITLPTKVHLVKAIVFPVVMCGCENWAIKRAEHRRTDAFKLRCWRRLWRVSCTARRSNQSILKEINPDSSLEGLIPKLKLQYFGHLIWRADSLEKTLMLGKIEGRRRSEWQRMRWLDGITNSMDIVWTNSGRWWRTGKSGLLQSMGSQRSGHTWEAEQQQPSPLNFNCRGKRPGAGECIYFAEGEGESKRPWSVAVIDLSRSQNLKECLKIGVIQDDMTRIWQMFPWSSSSRKNSSA